MIQDWLSHLLSSQGTQAALAVGLSLGVGVVLLLRAGQAWRYRQALGYTAYAADRLRRRLGRWAGLSVALAALVAGLFLWRSLQWPAGVALTSEQPVQPEKDADPLAGMELVIPRLGVQTELVEASFVAREWDVSLLADEAAHLAGTAYPGEEGNVVIAGHITIPGGGWGPFRELETLQPGDRVFLRQGSQTWAYAVVEVQTVAPTGVRVAFPTGDRRLTLITCAAWSDEAGTYTRRTAVIARFVP